MKLSELKNLICGDLIIIDHNTGIKHKDVWCQGIIFEGLEDLEVIGIRCDEHGYIIISVR